MTPLTELNSVQFHLRDERQNRVVDNKECCVYECLADTLKCGQNRTPRHPKTAEDREALCKIKHFTTPSNIQKDVADLLGKHNKVFLSVLPLLVENVPVQQQSRANEHEKQLEHFFQKVISECRTGRKYQDYVKLCLFASATCLNTPIYILYKHETDRLQWICFKPLFAYEGQLRCVIPYVTMYMSQGNVFYQIQSHDWLAEKPKASGLLGFYLAVLEDTSSSTISVPEELLRLPAETKSELCFKVSREIFTECCELLKERGLIQLEKYRELTAHKAKRRSEFQRLVMASEDAYTVLCQVLIRRREKTVLTPYVSDWSVFVQSCDYLAQFDALVALDAAIYDRNLNVSAFVNQCLFGGQEFDRRRKKVTTAVIVTSSVGIVSGGMVVAGILLAPISFGASLGLTIAGGAIGFGTGATAGTARAFEAFKQNTKMKGIKTEKAQIQNMESKVAAALKNVFTCFKGKIKRAQGENEEVPGISLRGFFALGSALRAAHCAAGIAVAAVRVTTVTAAAVSASILGPLSLVFDVVFLAEAAHNKRKGDKTNAGEALQTMAQTVNIKGKIFNLWLRGESDEQRRLIEWH